jgi:nucleoside-triphosphatase
MATPSRRKARTFSAASLSDEDAPSLSVRKSQRREFDKSEEGSVSLACAAMQCRWLLCTGQPGSGKTTLVRHLCDALASRGVRLRGFYTEEVLREGGGRLGFDVVTVPDGQRAVLSRKEGLPASAPRTGAYSVDVTSFESLALPSMACPEKGEDVVLVIDEIGRMELHSEAFQQAVRRLLSAPWARVVGAITSPIYGHRVPFCDDVAAQPQVSVRRITQKTRDAVREELLLEAVALARV